MLFADTRTGTVSKIQRSASCENKTVSKAASEKNEIKLSPFLSVGHFFDSITPAEEVSNLVRKGKLIYSTFDVLHLIQKLHYLNSI